MSDGIDLNAGSGGAKLASDVVSIGGTSMHAQRVKMGWGADGAYNDVENSAPMPVVQTGALPAGTALIGTVQPVPQATGGCSTARRVSTADTQDVALVTAAATLYGIIATNVDAAVQYLKLYDKATAPTNADTPKIVALLPVNSTTQIQFALGVAFANGIGLRLCDGAPDADNNATGANEIVATLIYK